MIPHSRPCLGADDAAAVLKVLESGHLVQGEMVAALESAMARWLTKGETSPVTPDPEGGKPSLNSALHNNNNEIHFSKDDSPGPPGPLRAAAVSSGTTALHLALLALGIGEGDEVIIPSYVCAALWHAVRAVGATAVLAECDGDTFNIAAAGAERLITDRTRAIIVPHLFGQAADLEDLLGLDVPVIEDCAQSLGSGYRNRPTGGFGVAAVFSFYATKVIAAGEGGMVVSRDERLIDRIRELRAYDEKDDLTLRFNGKLTEFQAALALSQLGKLPAFIARRRVIAGRYDRALERLGLKAPLRWADRDHIFFRYVILAEEAEAFITAMGKRGVTCRRPVYRPLHRYLGLPGFETTEAIWRRAVSIPLYPDLSDAEVAVVERALEETCREMGRPSEGG
ncbi:MAG: DegT/DnrJ/EryC1/StrS family aminotransferase [Pseudomonadota bacterium]|nr:DegT/DnrJ/EryC1/StrS family aminotransferase [Pseudomonadota bacterium]